MNGPVGAGEQPLCRMEDQAVAFALDALEPDEELAMRTHLLGCRSCRETVRETDVVAAALASSVEQADPPPRLRDNILATAAATPQLHARPASEPAEPDRDPSGAGPRADAEPPVLDARRRAPSRRRLALVAAAAAVAIGVGGLATYTVQVQQQRDALADQAQALAGIVTQLDQPGTAHATLSTGAGEPVAAVLVSAAGRTVVTHGLAPNDHGGTVYVMWGLGAGDPRPLGVFDVTAPGPAVYEMPGDDQPFSAYAVSLEPGRTMPAAPTDVVASGPVQA